MIRLLTPVRQFKAILGPLSHQEPLLRSNFSLKFKFFIFVEKYNDVEKVGKFFYLYDEANQGIDRKRLNTKDPEKWIKIELNTWPGRSLSKCLLSSQNEHGLLINQRKQVLSFINISKEPAKSKFTLFEFYEHNNYIMDLAVFGPKKNKAIVVTTKGWISALEFNPNQKSTKKLFETKIPLIKQRKEAMMGIAICKEERYVSVHTRDFGENEISRFFVLEVSGAEIKQKASLDMFRQGIGEIDGFSFIGYPSEQQVLFTGLTYDADYCHILPFCYDAEKGQVEVNRQLEGGVGLPEVRNIGYYDEESEIEMSGRDEEDGGEGSGERFSWADLEGFFYTASTDGRILRFVYHNKLKPAYADK